MSDLPFGERPGRGIEWWDRMDLARDVGEMRGDVKGLVTAMARLGAQIDEHLASDEQAHGRQDERILALMEKQAMAEGKHAAAVLWVGLVGVLLGAILLALLPDALALAHKL